MTDRARIPFGLIGVLLVVTSALYVASIHQPEPSRPAVDDTMEVTEAEVQTALRESVATAAHRAGRAPVLEPADTEMGRALNDSRPFRDALKLRIHERARHGFEAISGSRGDLSVVVSLPSITSTASAERAIDRVAIDETTVDGPAIDVAIENVTIAAVRDGQVVGEQRVSPTITVPTPVLAVHERVETFESRLNASVGSPGLSRRLTGRLYPVTWARGYAQYSGTPIQNVVANRHVALLTNGAILGLQAETFGHSDPVGNEILARSTALVGVTDLLAGIDFEPVNMLDELHGEVGLGEPPVEALGDYGDDVPERHSPERRMTVGVNGTADDAFLATVETLNETLRDAYSVDARVRATDVHSVRGGPTADISRAENSVESVGAADRTDGTRVGEWEVQERFDRLVEYHDSGIIVHDDTGSLPNGDAPVDYTEVVVETRPVVTPAPNRTIEPLYEPGGILDGPNFADVPDEAISELVPLVDGRDKLAVRAARGYLGTETVRVTAEQPANLTRWVYPELVDLRETVRNVSVEQTGGEVATFASNPAADLARAVEDNASSLLAIPDQYDGAADRARTAATADLLNRTIDRLDARAADHESRLAGVVDRIPDDEVDPVPAMQGGYANRATHSPGPGSPVDNLTMTVDASPSYLPTDGVGTETVPTIGPDGEEHPLVVRNLNVVNLPYGEIADGILSILSGPERAQLRTAAQALKVGRASEDAAEKRFPAPSLPSGDFDFDEFYATDVLAEEIEGKNRYVGQATRFELKLAGFGTAESRKAVIDRAMARWSDPAETALAIDNGSYARAVRQEAVAEWPDDLANFTARDRLGVRLTVKVRDLLDQEAAQPRAKTIDGTVDPATEFIRDEIASKLENRTQEAVEAKMDDYFERSFDRVPAGLPIAPLPGSWFATVNQWLVQARGEYTRFAVRVPRGDPARPVGGFEYVRDGSNVTVDLTGDGDPERLGRSRRVSFSTTVVVGIVVPPGSSGVGDVNGEMDERSEGWPDPGPT